MSGIPVVHTDLTHPVNRLNRSLLAKKFSVSIDNLAVPFIASIDPASQTSVCGGVIRAHTYRIIHWRY